MRSLALEWIATYLLRKGPKPPALRGNVFQKGGRLYVQPRAMLEAWDSVMAADQRRPDLSRFAQAVAGLAEEVRKVRLPPHGHERAYYIVNLEILSEWSDWTQNPTDELRSVLVNDSEDATL